MSGNGSPSNLHNPPCLQILLRRQPPRALRSMADKIDESHAGSGTPRDFPTTTPTETVSREYSFSLQALMELQKAVGQLSERMDSVRKQNEKQGEKLDSISHQIYAAWAVFGGPAHSWRFHNRQVLELDNCAASLGTQNSKVELELSLQQFRPFLVVGSRDDFVNRGRLLILVESRSR
jgi:hypothetical protein